MILDTPKKKIILLAVLIIILIGVWLYLFFVSGEKVKGVMPKKETPEEVLPTAPPVERHEFEEIEYEIISVGGPVYDIVTGKITEEQTEALTEKIIGDILVQTPDAQEITLLFYSDLITLGEGKVDVAEIIWMPEGINVKTK